MSRYHERIQRERRAGIVALIAIIVALVVTAWIEPCDGHSCTRDEVNTTR